MRAFLGRLRAEAPLLAAVLVIPGLCALWYFGAIGAGPFAKEILASSAVIIALLVTRRRRAQSTPLGQRALQLAIIASGFGALALLAFVAAMQLLDGLLFGYFSSVPSWYPLLERTKDLVTPWLLMGMAAAIIALWTSRESKLSYIYHWNELMARVLEALGALQSDPDRGNIRAESATAALLEHALRQRSWWRTRRGSKRTAFIFTEAADGRLDIALMYPPHRHEYTQGSLRPALWNEAAVAKCLAELREVRARCSGTELEHEESLIRQQLERVSSIPGFAAKNPGLCIFPDVTAAEYHSDKCASRFASKAVAQLPLADGTYVVLMLGDTAVGGFIEADRLAIEACIEPLRLLLPAALRGIQRGRFNATSKQACA